MARTKKLYPNGTKRGGTKPRATNTSFGAAHNLHKTPHKYESRPITLPPIGAYLMKRKVA